MSAENAIETGNVVEPSVNTEVQTQTDAKVETKTESAPQTAEGAGAGATPKVDPAQTYTPNWKYKAAQQEKEIEEFWRPLVKDADSEKRLKDFLSRADAFDFMKEQREKTQNDFKSLMQDYEMQQQVVNRVTGALDRGDLTSAFRQLGLKNEDIFRWTQEQITRMEMPPDQRKIYEEQEALKQQKYEMEQQISQYQTLYQQQAVQARTMQLETVLSKPEVSQMARAWDGLQGMEGAFKNLVIQEAQTAYYTTGRDLSADEAVQIVMSKFGKVIQPTGSVSPMQNGVTPSQTVTVPSQKPVIPNVSGKGTAPIKKVPKSLEDLKAMAKNLSDQGL